MTTRNEFKLMVMAASAGAEDFEHGHVIDPKYAADNAEAFTAEAEKRGWFEEEKG